jgi:hypothetical protein
MMKEQVYKRDRKTLPVKRGNECQLPLMLKIYRKTLLCKQFEECAAAKSRHREGESEKSDSMVVERIIARDLREV